VLGRAGRLDGHHMVKRAQGGSDWDLDALVALCRRCHTRTDAPFVKGRLSKPTPRMREGGCSSWDWGLDDFTSRSYAT